MKFLHTADWHIGQSFYNYDRTFEHRQFLNWLILKLKEEAIDVLLISGDIFDISNPSAASQKLFYRFLKNAESTCPDLQIIITAGNHDSASRLETPEPLLEASNVHIVGFVSRMENGEIDYEKLVIPLHGRNGQTEAWCLAIPFLRQGDYPAVQDVENTYAAGVIALYRQAFDFIKNKDEFGKPIVAMGHLHAQQAVTSEMDKNERLIMGGVEGISVTDFSDKFCYLALGHIHKAQKIGDCENIRYSGSPLPMSFSEIHYAHQVIIFEINSGVFENLKSVAIPVAVPLLKVPDDHQPLKEVLTQLSMLPEAADKDFGTAPYLEVVILLNEPEPNIRHKVEEALAGKFVRLARIDVKYENAESEYNHSIPASEAALEHLQPLDILKNTFQKTYGSDLPESLLQLFQQAAQEIDQNEIAG